MSIATRASNQAAPRKTLASTAPVPTAPANSIKNHYTCRFTGWQLVYGLREDLYRSGFSGQRDLGCLDAPTALPGGAVHIDEITVIGRFVSESAILREGI